MPKVDDYIKQTYRYFYDDGLVEISVGLLMLVVGSVLLGWQSVASSVLRGAILVVVLPAIILGGTVLVRRFVQKAKERVTYARTGYVSYRQGEPSDSRWYLLIATLLLFGLMLLLPESFNRTQFAVGYFLAAFLGLLGYRLGVRRFYAIAAGAFLIGLTATVTVADEVAGTGLIIAGGGLLLLLSGVLTIWFYLRQHPEPRNEQV